MSRLLDEIDGITILREHCDKPWQYRVGELDWIMRAIRSLERDYEY